MMMVKAAATVNVMVAGEATARKLRMPAAASVEVTAEAKKAVDKVVVMAMEVAMREVKAGEKGSRGGDGDGDGRAVKLSICEPLNLPRMHAA